MLPPLRASFILGELLNNCQPHLYRKGPDLLYLLSPLLQKLWCLSLPPIGTMLFFSDTIPHLRPPVACESFWALSSECTLLAQYITKSPNLPPIICVVDNFVYLKSDSEFLISCLYLPSSGIIGMYLPCLSWDSDWDSDYLDLVQVSWMLSKPFWVHMCYCLVMKGKYFFPNVIYHF